MPSLDLPKRSRTQMNVVILASLPSRGAGAKTRSVVYPTPNGECMNELAWVPRPFWPAHGNRFLMGLGLCLSLNSCSKGQSSLQHEQPQIVQSKIPPPVHI